MSAKRNKELVLRLYEEFDKGNLADVAESIEPEFVANVLGTATLDWPGFKTFGEAFRSAFPDGRHRFDHVVADRDYVATIGTYRCTHRGEMQGIPPTGRRLELAVMHLNRVVNGRIVEHRGMANEAVFLRQFGVVPEKGTEESRNRAAS